VEAGCLLKAALEIVGGDGLDGVVDGELDDGLGMSWQEG
jgi:hypothetical protein